MVSFSGPHYDVQSKRGGLDKPYLVASRSRTRPLVKVSSGLSVCWRHSMSSGYDQPNGGGGNERATSKLKSKRVDCTPPFAHFLLYFSSSGGSSSFYLRKWRAHNLDNCARRAAMAVGVCNRSYGCDISRTRLRSSSGVLNSSRNDANGVFYA